MNDIADDSPDRPTSWSTRTLAAAAIAAVVLGLGAGAALGSASGGSDRGWGRPGDGPGAQRGQMPPGMQQPATPQQPAPQGNASNT